ncbi:MAG: hypothetical protein D6808_01635 [Candidatus Dadabacteria bacterium]|nr:MAG: hypothetical protein D6808_01635 [Candidatus Dadabacteria bacterium]
MSGGAGDISNMVSIAGMNAAALRAKRLKQNLAEIRKKGGASSDSGDVKKSQQIEEASRQFEAMLLHEMLKSMWKSVPEGGIFGGSNEAEIYRDMFNEALADEISKGEGVGIREIIARDIRKLENK